MILNKKDFAENALKSAFKYEEDILSGKVITNEYIKLAVKRRIKLTDKYHYNEKAVTEVFKFMYYINLTVDNKVQRMNIMPWQAWLILSIYGLYRDEKLEKRLVREALIFIARKQGKSSIAAILALYEMLKGERHPEVYVVSMTRDQASQIFKYWGQIIKDSPALRKRLVKRQYHIQTDKNGLGIAKAEVNEPERLNGKNVSLGIVDEAAILPTKDLFQVLQTGTVQRKNPLMMQISTASAFKSYYFHNDVEIGKRVLKGEVDADNTFYALYTLDDEKEIDDPEMWIKAMPALGELVSLEDMILAYEKACLTVSDRIDFHIKHFNLFQDNETAWIPDDDYKQCFNEVDENTLYGKKVYLGLDLSSTRDLASLVAVVEGDDGKLNIIPEFYFPTKDNEENKIRKSGIDLTAWIEKGFIQPHDNKIINYSKIVDRIKYYSENYDLQGISYDSWSSSILMSQIESELFVDLYAAPQNASYFNFPLKYIERLIYSEMINLSDNPVLRWHFSNVVLYRDGNNNIKILKNKSKDSVDGCVSMAMAVGLYAKLNFDAVSVIMDEYNGANIELNKQE